MNLYRFGQILVLICFFNYAGIKSANGQASVVSGSVSTSKTNYSPGLGNNRLLVVSVSNETNNNVRSVTGITWGGQSLVFASSRVNGGSGSNDLRAEIWYLNEAGINAASANCNTFVVTWSAGITTETFAVYTLKDVNQTTPVATTNGAAPAANNTVVALPSTAVSASSIICYATATQGADTHTPATGYTEQSDQIVGAATALATATKQITGAGNETPGATWSASNQILITAVVFSGVAATGPTTYYSRNATLGGAWDDNTSWTTNSNGSGGPLAAGIWPKRQDHVVILAGHTITVNNVADNKSCGVSPDNLLRSNVGSFIPSNIAMFYHLGDITIRGTFVVAGVELMIEGYTHLVTGGTFSPTSFLVNTGYLEVDAGTTLTGFNSLVLTGNSVTTINTNSSFVDDLIIDHTDATLCGSGTAQLQNGPGSIVTFTNSGSLNQICSTFTVTCTGGCAGFPVTGTGGSLTTGNRGPGGVGSTTGNSQLVVWLDANTLTGSAIANWPDLSGYNNHGIQATAGNQPARVINAVNGFPVVRFDGTDDVLNITDNASIDLTAWSFFMVGKVTTHKNYNGFFVKGNDGAENFEFLSNFPSNGSIHIPVLYTTAARSADAETGTSMSNTVYNVFEYDYDNVNLSLYSNLNQIFTRAETRTPAVNALPLWIGNDGGVAGRNLSGDIAEFIAYNTKINPAQQRIVSTYMSAKYNTALAGDVYTMDDSGNGNFDYEVAGVGQASDGSNHKDARGSGIVRMVVQSGASLTNAEYLIWGHNSDPLWQNTTDVDGVVIRERLRRIWRVSEVGDVGPVAISFDINSLGTNPIGSNLRLLIDRDGDGFADNDVTPLGGGTYTGKVITFGGVNLQSGDRFTLGNTDLVNPLPVELLSFTAVADGNTVTLNWRTASELENDYFMVQRSEGGELWEDVVRIEGADNSTSQRDYHARDNKPHFGVSYYRLKQVDWDGEYSYSQVRRVEVTEQYNLNAYPNPATGSFRVTTGFALEANDVQLMDMMGKSILVRLVVDEQQGVVIEPINASPGMYILHVAKGFWKQSLRIVIR